MALDAFDLAEKASSFFKASIATGLAGATIGGALQIILTVVSIAVGIMAFKHYRLSNELKRMQIAREKREGGGEGGEGRLKVV